MKKEFGKKYQVWNYTEGNSYSMEEFDTLEEAIAAPKYSQWYITKAVILSLEEKE